MLSIRGENCVATTVNGCFKPDVAFEDFLARFSAAGATYHSVLVYGESASLLKKLAEFLPVEMIIIE